RLAPFNKPLCPGAASAAFRRVGLRPRRAVEGLPMRREDRGSKRNNSEAAWLRAVVETAVDGVILIDAQGLIMKFNPACELLRRTMREDVEIVTDFDPERRAAFADPAQLESA